MLHQSHLYHVSSKGYICLMPYLVDTVSLSVEMCALRVNDMVKLNSCGLWECRGVYALITVFMLLQLKKSVKWIFNENSTTWIFVRTSPCTFR